MSRLGEARRRLSTPFAAERLDLVAGVAETLLGPRRGRPLPAPPPISPFGRAAPRSRSSPRASPPACRTTPWRGRAALSSICRRRMSRPSFSIPGCSPIWPETPISCGCRTRSAPGCGRSSISFSSGLQAAGRRFAKLFVHYPSQGDLGAKISALSDARVVWGGDAKVALFAPLPLRNGGKSIWFGDRFSFSTIKGAALPTSSTTRRCKALAKKLHNDIFVFDQMACSSPHALYVVGEATAHSAPVRRLLDASALEWTMDDPAGRVGHAIGKMTAAFYAAANGRASSVHWRNTQLTSIVASAPMRQDIRVGGGFLSVVFVRSLAEVASFIRESDQTITYFGWERGEIEAIARVTRRARRVALGADRDRARLRLHLGRLRHPLRADAPRAGLLIRAAYWRRISIPSRCSTLTRRLRKLAPSRFTSPASGARMRASTSFI